MRDIIIGIALESWYINAIKVIVLVRENRWKTSRGKGERSQKSLGVGREQGNRTVRHRTWEAMMLEKLKRFLQDRRGITGLETAIILIAFVVVASVFAYTVLAAGLFSARKGQEAIYGGLKKVSETMEIRGAVIARDTGTSPDGKVDQVVFTVALTVGNEPVDLNPPKDDDGDGTPDSGSTHKTIISYMDDKQWISNLAWSKTLLGYGDSDNLLEPNEQFEITVNLAKVNAGENPLGVDTNFTIEVKPSQGAVLTITRTTPGSINAVQQLY